jgi:hypothetical protein
MPQMPGEGGAPSDIGPDGGVLPPDAIGPDGLPAGGMPPGDEEMGGDGAPPPFADDEEDDGDEDPDGPPGEEAEGPSGPPAKVSPPPKGKGDTKGKGDSKKPPPSKKKSARMASWDIRAHIQADHPELTARLHGDALSRMSDRAAAFAHRQDHDNRPQQWHEHDLVDGHPVSSFTDPGAEDSQWLHQHGIEGRKLIRTYRGLGGEVLTEDQYVRHLAASLSGGHPQVLAQLRAEAAGR